MPAVWSRRRFAALERGLVWLAGSPRTGSTWLLHLLAAHPQVHGIDEPLIGEHLGVPAATTIALSGTPHGVAGAAPERVLDRHADRDDYFFARRWREDISQPLRELLLARLSAQFTSLGGRPGRDLLVVKEPNGSEAIDLLTEVLPRSRLLVVVRDGRDVADSLADGLRPGGWANGLGDVPTTAAGYREWLTGVAGLWNLRTGIAVRAAAALPAGQAMTLRYEDLLADTATVVQHITDWLGLPHDAAVDEAVQRLAYGRLPDAAKGPGRFARAARPGGWRENFGPGERALLTTTMGPLLDRLGYDVD